MSEARAILPALAAGCLVTLCLLAPPAVAQTAPPPPEPSAAGTGDATAGMTRQAVRDDLMATVGLTCEFDPETSEADARRQCLLRARTRLVAKLSGRVAALADSLRLPLTDEEIAAFTLQLLRVEADREEVESGPSGLVVRLAGRAVADMGDLPRTLPLYAGNGDLRASAVAQYRAAMVEAGHARPSAADPATEQAEAISREMRDTARFAERHLRLGMSIADVRGLLGEPGSWVQGAPDEHFVCLGYGDVWAVFENGELACLRTRLEYHRRHDSRCHCSGRLATILLGVEPR